MKGGLDNKSYGQHTFVVIITTLDGKIVIYAYEYELKSDTYSTLSNLLELNFNRKIIERLLKEEFLKNLQEFKITQGDSKQIIYDSSNKEFGNMKLNYNEISSFPFEINLSISVNAPVYPEIIDSHR
jgi:hypothetical protein